MPGKTKSDIIGSALGTLPYRLCILNHWPDFELYLSSIMIAPVTAKYTPIALLKVKYECIWN